VVGGNPETSQRAIDAIVRALEPAVPEQLTAGGSTGPSGPVSSKRASSESLNFGELHIFRPCACAIRAPARDGDPAFFTVQPRDLTQQ